MATKLAVITGASSGIGYNLAKVFAENGYDLVIASAGDRLDQAETDFRALGVTVTAIQEDLATYDGIEALWKGIQALGRPVDAVCLNAGIGSGGLFLETDLETELKLIRLNVEGTVHLAKHVVRHMVANGYGKILVTASIVSEMVAPRELVYAASKSFDLAFAKGLRAELKDTGVTVTALQPGPTDTDFFDREGAGNSWAGTDGKKHSQPYDMAKQGFTALMNGDDHVYGADLMTKVEGALMDLVPESIQAAMHNKMAKPRNE